MFVGAYAQPQQLRFHLTFHVRVKSCVNGRFRGSGPGVALARRLNGSISCLRLASFLALRGLRPAGTVRYKREPHGHGRGGNPEKVHPVSAPPLALVLVCPSMSPQASVSMTSDPVTPYATQYYPTPRIGTRDRDSKGVQSVSVLSDTAPTIHAVTD
jgi:hypothetical protein